MANYNTLKTAVADVIKTNGNKEITGALLQQTLLAIIDSLGSQYQFAGKAVEGTTPGTVDTKVMYLAGPGTYSNFGGAVIPEQHIGILYGSGSTWNVSTIKVSPIAIQTVIDDIIQLYDGTTPVYPRTKAEAVFFNNDTAQSLDKKINTIDYTLYGYKKIKVVNGSQGNSANAWVVTLRGVDTVAIPVIPGHKYKLTINKTPQSGYNFYWRIYTYSTDNPAKLYSSVVRNETINWDHYHTNEQSVEIEAGELGLSIQLTELTEPGAAQATGTCIPLRLTDFVDGDLVLQDITEALVNVGEEIQDIKTELSAKDLGNNVLVRVGSTVLYNRIYFEEKNVSAASVYCRFLNLYFYKNSNKAVGITFADFVSQIGGTIIAMSPNGMTNCVEIESNKKIVFNTQTNTFSLLANNIPLTENQILFFAVLNGRVIKFGNEFIANIISTIEEKERAIRSSITGKVVQWRNGTPGAAGNANCVTSAIVPRPNKRKITINVTRPNTTGYRYVYGLVLTNSVQELGNYPQIGNQVDGTIVSAKTISVSQFSNEIVLTDAQINANYTGMMVVLGESDGTNWNPLRIGDLDGKDVFVTHSDESASNPVCERNMDKYPMLVNSCRLHKLTDTSKDFQVTVCTDMHNDTVANNNAIDATNGFDVIDAYVNCGDICSSYYLQSQIATFRNSLNKLAKPGYIVCGNHDVGNCYYVGYSCNHEQAYDAYIKPMVELGWLVSGEYEANKPYWFHDNATYKIRIIGLYEYDDNLDLNETYWKAIAYDASLADIAFNTSYVVGNRVKVPGYTAYSFECLQNLTTPANYYTTPQYLPSYRVLRGSRVIRQTQAQWFLDVLASTPANYGVIVVMHNPLSANAVSLNKKFSWPSDLAGSAYIQSDMQTELIQNALIAFKDQNNYTEKVVMKRNAAYLNVLNDGTIDYAYSVSKDFSQLNSGVHFLGVIGGHSHKDLIWKAPADNIYQIAPVCAVVNSANSGQSDIRRTSAYGIARDSLTIISFAADRIGLVKIGVNVTDRGTFRDYEVLDTSV